MPGSGVAPGEGVLQILVRRAKGCHNRQAERDSIGEMEGPVGRWLMWLAAAMLMADLPAEAAPVRSGGKVDLVPHKATYDLRLGRVRSGGDVVGAKGSMVMETAKSCAGWTLKHRFRLTLINNEGNRIETNSDFSSFESIDGLTYRFTSRTTRNGAVTDDVQGNARLASLGAPGHADFTRPKGTLFDLPKGTIFPTEHVAQLIAGARRGQRRVFKIIFDGQSKDGALEVNAFIGGYLAQAPAKWAKNTLTNRPSWFLRLAFFPVGSSKAAPQHEAGLRIFDNGVADEFEWDWGTFTVEGTLKSLEALPRPKC